MNDLIDEVAGTEASSLFIVQQGAEELAKSLWQNAWAVEEPATFTDACSNEVCESMFALQHFSVDALDAIECDLIMAYLAV